MDLVSLGTAAMAVTVESAIWLALALAALTLAGLIVCAQTAVHAMALLPNLSHEDKAARELPGVAAVLRDEPLARMACDLFKYPLILIGLIAVIHSIDPESLSVVAFFGKSLIGLVALLLMVDILPRSLAFEYYGAIMRVAWLPLRGMIVVAGPIIGVCRLFMRDLFRLEAPIESEHPMDATSEEPQVDPTRLQDRAYRMIDSVLKFGETRVDDVYTPFSEVRALPVDLPREELEARMREIDSSRVPIYEDSTDKIVGVLHVKDLLLNPNKDLREILRPPLFVMEGLGLFDLLREFKRNRSHIAIVVNHFGASRGVITMHDLLESIVGKMRDESEPVEKPMYKVNADGALSISGQAELEFLRTRLGVNLPNGEVRTIGGLVMHHLERLPRVGDQVVIEPYRLKVTSMDERVVRRLRVERTNKDAPIVSIPTPVAGGAQR